MTCPTPASTARVSSATRLVVAVQARSARRGSRPRARPRARRRCRRPGRGPRRRSSARRPCTGTPCRRSRRRRRRTALRRRPGPGRAGRPRRGVTPACRARRPGRCTATPPTCSTPSTRVRRGRPDRRVERVEVGRGRPTRVRLGQHVGVPRTGRVGGSRHRLHPLRGGDAEQVQAVGQHDPGRLVQPQPGAVDVGDLVVALRDDPALVVPAVVGAGEVLEVARDAVRRAQLGRAAPPPAGTRRAR